MGKYYAERTLKNGDVYTNDPDVFGGDVLVDGPTYKILDAVCGPRETMTAIERFLRPTESWSRVEGTWNGQRVMGFAKWDMDYFLYLEKSHPGGTARVRL